MPQPHVDIVVLPHGAFNFVGENVVDENESIFSRTPWANAIRAFKQVKVVVVKDFSGSY